MKIKVSPSNYETHQHAQPYVDCLRLQLYIVNKNWFGLSIICAAIWYFLYDTSRPIMLCHSYQYWPKKSYPSHIGSLSQSSFFPFMCQRHVCQSCLTRTKIFFSIWYSNAVMTFETKFYLPQYHHYILFHVIRIGMIGTIYNFGKILTHIFLFSFFWWEGKRPIIQLTYIESSRNY